MADSRTARLRALWIFVRLAWVCLAMLVLLAVLVNVPHSPVVWLDVEIAQWLDSHRTTVRVGLSRAIIVWGNERAIIPLTLITASLVAIRMRSVLLPLAIVGAVAVSGVVSLAMKALLPSHHPDPGLGDPPALAHMFPSSHTAVVITLVGVVAVAVFGQRTNLYLALAGAAIVSALMASALVIGHFHWFSDILGGTLLAVGVVGATRDLLRPAGARQLLNR